MPARDAVVEDGLKSDEEGLISRAIAVHKRGKFVYFFAVLCKTTTVNNPVFCVF